MGSYRAVWGVTPISKAVAGEWSVRAVLTLPVLDLAGDLVRPEGLDFCDHEADPWVDLEHGRTSVRREPVGWARKSLHRPGAPYAVEWADLDVPGLGTCRLPVGTTYFDRDDPLQRQVYELVRQDALPGVSLEFLPVESRVIADRSPLEPRPAYEFLKARVLRWSHCAEPVNPGALTVLKSIPPSAEVIAKALRDGRLAGEPLHPYLRQTYDGFRVARSVAGVGHAGKHLEVRQVHKDGKTYEQHFWVSDKTGDGSGSGASHRESHVSRLLAGAGRVAAKLKSAVNARVSKAYGALVEKYGPTGAKVALVAFVLAVPIPAPGSSFVAAAAAAQIYKMLRRQFAKAVGTDHAGLDIAAIRRDVETLTAELYALAGEEPPTLDPDRLDQIIAQLLTENKVMPDDLPDDRDTAYEPDEDLGTAGTDVSDDSPPNNGVSALYAHVQTLLDACEQLEQDLEATDNPELYKAGQQLCEQTRALAEKIKAVADKHDAKLQSLKSGSGDAEDAEAEDTGDMGDISTDREGMLKAVRPVYRDVLKAARGRVKRYRMRDIVAGVKRARDPLAAIEEVKAKDPEGYARLIEPRLRRLRMYSE